MSDSLREAAAEYLFVSELWMRGVPLSDEEQTNLYRRVGETRANLEAALASPAARPHVLVNAAGQCACGARWSEEHAASFASPAAPRPEGLDVERLALAQVRSGIDTFLPAEERWISANEAQARIAAEYLRLSDTGDTPKE